MECEGLLECVYGLNDLDKEIFQLLASQTEPLTVDSIAKHVDRERSTVYRSVQRLLECGFVEREQISYQQASYTHVFSLVDPDRIADNLEGILERWNENMGELIGEFREKYTKS